jgi:hypothetical protein
LNHARIKQFWDWFRARADKVREDPGRYGDEISEMLERIQPGLAWEMGGKGQDWDFVVRTEDATLRFATYQIVSAAPRMEQWRISSWRLPEALRELRIRVGEGKEFDLLKFSFELETDPRFPLIHLTAVSPQFGPEIGSGDKYAGYLAIDALLGEKQVEDVLDSVEFRGGTAGPIAASELSSEVRRRLADVYARPIPAPNDQWAAMRGTKGDRPWLALVATGIDVSLMPTHPWRVDVSLMLQNPLEDGMPSSEELGTLRPIEDQLVEVVDAGRRGFVWTHRSHDGRRTTSFYVQDPLPLQDRLRSILEASGLQGDLEISYDPRWRLWRAFAEQA